MIGHYKRSKYLAEQAVQELIEREGQAGSRPMSTPGRRGAVDDVAAGHLLAVRGAVGERYILGGQLLLGEILTLSSGSAGRGPAPAPARCPDDRLSQRDRGPDPPRREPLLTVDGLRMARKRMHYTSAKAERELGYRRRPAAEAVRDALAWYRHNGYLANIPEISVSPSASAQ